MDAVYPGNLESFARCFTGVVLTAFDAYHAHCRETLELLVGDIPADRLQVMADTLEEGRLGFLDAALKG